jgi:hypothetical protein
MRIKSGGGIQSRQVSHRHEPKVEPKAHKANVASGAQQGLSTQFPKAPLQQRAYQPVCSRWMVLPAQCLQHQDGLGFQCQRPFLAVTASMDDGGYDATN